MGPGGGVFEWLAVVCGDFGDDAGDQTSGGDSEDVNTELVVVGPLWNRLIVAVSGIVSDMGGCGGSGNIRGWGNVSGEIVEVTESKLQRLVR